MKDQYKTKAQLISELAQLRAENAELKMLNAGGSAPEKPYMREDHPGRKILDTLIEHVVYHDMELNVLWANRAACQSQGLDLDQVVGRHCYEIWARRATPCDNCPVIVSRETGQMKSVEKKTPDGRYWYIKSSPVFDANGKMEAVVELTLDISERKKMERALKKSEESYRTLVETIPHGIQEIDLTGGITFANPAFNRTYGYGDKEMAGQSILDLQTSASAKTALSAYLARLVEEQPEPAPYIAKNYTKGGKVIDVQVDWTYKRNDQGRVTGFISVVTDVTEKKRAKAALQQANEHLEQRVQERTTELLAANEKLVLEVNERKKAQAEIRKSEKKYQELYNLFRLIVDTVPDLIWAKDLADRFIFVNQAMCHKLLGCSHPDEAIGKTDMFFAQRERNQGYIHTFGDMCVNSDAVTKESKAPGRFLEKGLVRSQNLVLNTHKAPLFNEKGELIGTVGCGQDVTEEKISEDTLKASQAELNTIFEIAPVATVIVDRDHRVWKVNQAALALTSRLEEEMVGRRGGGALGCFHAFDDSNGCGFGLLCKTCKVRLAISETFQSGKPCHEIEAMLPLADQNGDQKLHLLVSTAPFKIFGKDRVAICLQDITGRKRAEAQLNTLNKALFERTNLAEQRAVYIQQLALELSDAEDRERRRIASILHDDFQQQLAYIQLELGVLQRSAGEQIGQALGGLRKLIGESITKALDFSYNINPPVLTRMGFAAALKSLAREMNAKRGLKVTLHIGPGIEPGTLALSSILYRAARELLFNVAKHAGVDTAQMVALIHNGMIQIEVKDAGNGFDYGWVRSRQGTGAGFGLYSIEDRVTFLGGNLNIETAPQKGCRAVLTVPQNISYTQLQTVGEEPAAGARMPLPGRD